MTGNILIIARNNLHLTKRAVSSALAQDTPCEVLVVDNCSSDGTAQWLRSKHGIASCHMVKQESLADCWNLGLQTLWCNSYSPVLVINNDVEIRRDTYAILHDYQSVHEDFITGISVRTIDEMEAPINGGLVSSPHPDFSCFLIPQGVYENVGQFDGDYWPAYCEDADYHVRMYRAGVSAVSINLPFLHHGAQTLANASPGEATSIRKGADKCRELFRSKYGCVPGTPEYSNLFT